MRGKLIISASQIIIFFLIVIGGVLAFNGAYEVIAAIPILLVFLIRQDITKTELYGIIIFGSIFVYMMIRGMIVYKLFSQAAALYNVNSDVIYWFQIGHIHAIRLLIGYPGVLLGKWLGITVDEGCTIYSVILLLFIVLFMVRILYKNNQENRLTVCICGLFILLLSFLMNGRLIYAFFGITLLVLYEIKYTYKECSILTLQLITIVALGFSAVSSGILIVVSAYILMITPYRWKRLFSSNEYFFFVLTIMAEFFPIVTVIFPYINVMLLKNINHFGGGMQGVVNMLQHGLGKVLYTDSFLLLVFLIIAGCVFFIINIYLFWKYIVLRNNLNLPLVLMVNVGLYGSLFGMSTGLVALIPLVVLMIERFGKRRIKFIRC